MATGSVVVPRYQHDHDRTLLGESNVSTNRHWWLLLHQHSDNPVPVNGSLPIAGGTDDTPTGVEPTRYHCRPPGAPSQHRSVPYAATGARDQDVPARRGADRQGMPLRLSYPAKEQSAGTHDESEQHAHPLR